MPTEQDTDVIKSGKNSILSSCCLLRKKLATKGRICANQIEQKAETRYIRSNFEKEREISVSPTDAVV